jgi:hypothetical protein
LFKIFQKDLASSQDNLELIILSETLKTPLVNLYSLNFEVLQKHKRKPLNQTALKFDQILQKRDRFLIENVCLTSKSSFLVLYYECEVYVIDTASALIRIKESVSSPRMTLDYFLSPTNVNATHLASITPIPKNESVMALNNLNHLVLVGYNLKEHKLNLSAVVNEKNEPIELNSFKINRDNALIGYLRKESSLIVVNLEKLLRGPSLKLINSNIIHEIRLAKGNVVGEYGLSEEDSTYAYLIENRKVLRFFNVKTRRELIKIPLYSEPTFLLCNSEFICMSMQDNRVISFLINDPGRADALERIKCLPSRKINPANEDKALMIIVEGKSDSIINKDESRKDNLFYKKVLHAHGSDEIQEFDNDADFECLKKSDY